MPFGTTILEAAKSVGVRIPTLCYHPDLDVAGVCRICVVEVEGQRTLQAACAYPDHQRRSRSTRTPARCAWPAGTCSTCCSAEHYGECYTCMRNGNCELQALAEEYGVDRFRFGHPDEPRLEVDDSSYSVDARHEQVHPLPPLRAHLHRPAGSRRARGRRPQQQDRRSRPSCDKPLADVVCINCGQCINRCPTGALYAKDATDAVWAAIDDPDQARGHPDGPVAPRRPWASCSASSPARRSPSR